MTHVPSRTKQTILMQPMSEDDQQLGPNTPAPHNQVSLQISLPLQLIRGLLTKGLGYKKTETPLFCILHKKPYLNKSTKAFVKKQNK